MFENQFIGVFDSGIGGLSIAKCIRATLPHENIIYVADTHHAPYGDKTDHFIAARSESICRFLQDQGAKSIVVACNTATTSAIQYLRSRFSLPIVGVEPGTKPAAMNSLTGVVGVLATARTLATESFERLLQRTSGPAKIELQACPDLVRQVELLKLDGDETHALVHGYVMPLIEKGADHIVLGCTHYNFLESVVAQIAGPNVKVINTAQAVTNELVRQLTNRQLLASSGKPGMEKFFTSGDTAVFQQQINTLWNGRHTVLQWQDAD